MDIGKNIRSFRVEPIHDPVPRRRDDRRRAAPTVAVDRPVAPTSHPLPSPEHAIVLMTAPALQRRFGE